MTVGTIDLTDESEHLGKKLTGLRGGSGPSGGGGDQGGGGANKPDDTSPLTEPEIFRPAISRILTGFLLLVVMMTFGGLIAAYIVIATNNVAEWRPFDLPIQVWISTALIVLSSVTYHLGSSAVGRNAHESARKWFIVTTVLGAAFISSQILAWMALSARGLYVGGNPYAGFFYVMTAVHAVHVLGGIAALGSILLRAWFPTQKAAEIEKRSTIANVVGWYWHFMGALWIVLFVLLGFWK
ncbi:MAG: cytochrome c oxidase subunit 3 [Pyrinomonadaceae bacterium]